jgi:hypothetical protein
MIAFKAEYDSGDISYKKKKLAMLNSLNLINYLKFHLKAVLHMQ